MAQVGTLRLGGEKFYQVTLKKSELGEQNSVEVAAWIGLGRKGLNVLIPDYLSYS